MSDIPNKANELSDVVLLPYNFPLLNPPPFVIQFLKNIDDKLLESSFVFPLDALRNLYKKDKHLFNKIKFFLSLYGCNFHSKKPNSFFPDDVEENEDVICYYGAKEDTFSVSEIAPLGIWNFCGYAGGCKCSYFDGVVIKRLLKEIDTVNLDKLLSYPKFSKGEEPLFMKAESPTIPNGSQKETAPIVSDTLFHNDAINNGYDETSKDSSSETLIEMEKDWSSMGSVKDFSEEDNEGDSNQSPFSAAPENAIEDSLAQDKQPQQAIRTDDIKERDSDVSNETKETYEKSNESLFPAVQPDLIENAALTVSDSKEVSNPFVPEGNRKGICAPSFWLRFVCSFFTMVDEAKSVYRSLGYNKFGDLVEFKDEDIEKTVKGIQQTGVDIYLQGIYEEDLVSYCLSRKRFLAERSINSFENYLSFEKSVPELFSDKDILYVDYTDRPYLIKGFDDDEDSMPEISNLYLSYLKRFGIHNLLFIGDGILDDPIDCYSLMKSDRNLCWILNPYRVVESLCCELMEKSNDDPFGLDKELAAFRINDFPDFYKFDYGKYENDKLGKRLEILSLRESGNFTLEELGKKYGVTRERVRQIEAKALKIIAKGADTYLDLLFFRRNFVPVLFLKNIPGLIAYIKSGDSSYYYCEELGVVVRGCQQNFLSKEERSLVRDGYTVVLDDVCSFYKRHGFSVYPWLNRESYHVGFSPFPYFTFKKIPLKQLGIQYLLSKGIDGFNVNADQEEAINFFKENAPYLNDLASYRAIFNDIIRSGAVLRGMSTYISPELVTEEQKQIVTDILKRTSLGAYGATGPSIFADNQELLLQHGIDNGYFFYGIASYFLKDKYDFSGRGLRISSWDRAMTLDEMAEHYIVTHGPIVKVKDFLEGLRLKEPALQQIKIISKYDSNTLIRKDWLKWTRAEFESLEPFIDEKIKEKAFCHATEILKSTVYFDDSRNHFLQENRIGTSPSRLIYFMDAIAERYGITKYHFSHHADCISLASNPIETKVDMAKANFKGRFFDVATLENFYRPFQLTGSLAGSGFFEGWAIPVSLNSYALKDDVIVSDNDLERVSEILDEYYADELYITATSAMNRIVSLDFPQKFDNHPIELAGLLSLNPNSNWVNPDKDELITSNFYLNLLVNKRLIGKSSIKYSGFIREFIHSKFKGRFLSFAQIAEELKKYEVLNKRLPDEALSQIFVDWCNDDGTVEVPE